MTKVLVVDDVADNVKLLAYELADQGYDTIEASNGPQALELAKAERPDVILLDIMMPGMDGIEVCRRLKVDPILEPIPVIMVSAREREEDVIRGLDAGAYDYITKPFNSQIVAARVRSAARAKGAHDQIAILATTDSLTGLPNRNRLQEHLACCVASDRENDKFFALLLLDLDRFKEINDTFGHHYGDAVLRELNPRLSTAVRGHDTVARLGGDEFGILLPGVDRSGAVRTAERLLASLERPFVVEGQSVEIGTSIGIALYPEHGRDPATLMKRADVAMYASKRARSGHAVYTARQSDLNPERLTLISDLRRGIGEGQLLLHYQPKVDLATMRTTKVEALVRWLHPREGLIMPDQFIPQAEQMRLIKPLTLWVLETALAQCRAWHEAGIDLDVAVNLVPDSLQDSELVSTIADLLKSSGAAPDWLTLEITESAMMSDPAHARSALKRLHAMGVKIAIDDFGTGYSSLAHLKDLPVDEVKVDRSFVKDMSLNDRDACIVRTVIDLGHNLGLHVVAEGVEDSPTHALLTSLGSDIAQGYYYSRPLPATDIPDWIRRSTKSLAPVGMASQR